MARGFNRDHEHYVLKNRMLAAATEISRRGSKSEKKGGAPAEREKSCFNCKLKKTCTQFRAKRSGGASGVVSFGGFDETMVCERYEPAPRQNRGMSEKQIKSLMRSFRRDK
jgi:hypothetical protein